MQHKSTKMMHYFIILGKINPKVRRRALLVDCEIQSSAKLNTCCNEQEIYEACNIRRNQYTGQ